MSFCFKSSEIKRKDHSNKTKIPWQITALSRGNIHPVGTRAVLFPLETAAVSISREVIVFPPNSRMDTSSCCLTREKWECDLQSGMAGYRRGCSSAARSPQGSQPQGSHVWNRTSSWLLESLTLPNFCNAGEQQCLQRDRTPQPCCCRTFSGPHHCSFKEWGKAGGQIF